MLKHFVAHEYFHMIQAHNYQGVNEEKVSGHFNCQPPEHTLWCDRPPLDSRSIMQNINSSKQSFWIYEGTATWFMDALYDAENPWEQLSVGYPLPDMIWLGIGSYVLEGNADEHVDGYYKFAFFKLIETYCDKMNYTAMFTWRPPQLDHTRKLADKHCHFEGEESHTWLRMLMSYADAAVHDDLNLLDKEKNEPVASAGKPALFQDYRHEACHASL